MGKSQSWYRMVVDGSKLTPSEIMDLSALSMASPTCSVPNWPTNLFFLLLREAPKCGEAVLLSPRPVPESLRASTSSQQDQPRVLSLRVVGSPGMRTSENGSIVVARAFFDDDL